EHRIRGTRARVSRQARQADTRQRTRGEDAGLFPRHAGARPEGLSVMPDVLMATVVHDLKNSLGVLVEELKSLQNAAADSALAADVNNAHGIASQLSA